MSNAKTDFIEAVKEVGKKPKAALFEEVYWGVDEKDRRKFLLPVGYTNEQYSGFLESLDFKYDDGYGSQVFGGTIWFDDGTYCDRGEYDGSEWWEYHEAPEIPVELS